MRIPLLILFFIVSTLSYAQRDSCGCFNLRPMPEFILDGTAFAVYTKYQETKPYTGICHVYHMKGKPLAPDYSRTYKYARFKNGELTFFIQFNDEGDTTAYYHRIDKDSVIAELKRYNYQTGVFEWREIYYYSGGSKRMKWLNYDPSGFVKSELNYFYPPEGDSLKYYDSHINYKKESVLSPDHFYNMPVQSGPYFEYGGIGGKVVTVEGAYFNGSKNGKWIERYPSGKIKSEGGYSRHNWKDGNWKEWYENGQLKSDIDYLNSNFCGNYEEWYESGQLKDTGHYENCRRNGTFIEYWPNGQMKKRETFEQGKYRSIEAWYESGQQQSMDQYTFSGQPDGVHTNWFENGKVMSQEEYVEGVHKGPFKEYYLDGTLFHQVDYNGNSRIAESWYYSNGQLRSNQVFKGYGQEGPKVMYYRSGKILLRENYFNNLREGMSVTYAESGKIISEINYHQERWDGTSRWYYANGKLWREANYTNGIRNGPFCEWDESGKIYYKQTYNNGAPVQSNKPVVYFARQEFDSLHRVYMNDSRVAAAAWINDPSSNYNALRPDTGLCARVLGDLLMISKYCKGRIDSVSMVHFDSTKSRTHIYLDYPQVPPYEQDTSGCPVWPKKFRPYIEDLDLVLVNEECYGDDNLGIRRGFTSSQYFNGHTLDSLLKRENKRYGCEYHSPNNYYEYSNDNRIDVRFYDNYADYTYMLFYPERGRLICATWHFRVYNDGSIDYLKDQSAHYDWQMSY